MNKDYIEDEVREIIANSIRDNYSNGVSDIYGTFTLQTGDNEWVDVSWTLIYTIAPNRKENNDL